MFLAMNIVIMFYAIKVGVGIGYLRIINPMKGEALRQYSVQ